MLVLRNKKTGSIFHFFFGYLIKFSEIEWNDWTIGSFMAWPKYTNLVQNWLFLLNAGSPLFCCGWYSNFDELKSYFCTASCYLPIHSVTKWIWMSLTLPTNKSKYCTHANKGRSGIVAAPRNLPKIGAFYWNLCNQRY